jgi:hypothetical protein
MNAAVYLKETAVGQLYDSLALIHILISFTLLTTFSGQLYFLVVGNNKCYFQVLQSAKEQLKWSLLK